MSAYFPTKILLATDGSEDASAATRAAVDLAKRSGSELHVVHASEFILPREYMSVALRLRSPSGFAARGHELLDEQVERIEELGIKVAGAQVRMGSPVDQIISAGEEIGTRLVVIGRRGPWRRPAPPDGHPLGGGHTQRQVPHPGAPRRGGRLAPLARDHGRRFLGGLEKRREAGGEHRWPARVLGRIQRARVGSVSTNVVRAADGPVLIHPQAPERPVARKGESEPPGETSFWDRLFDDRYRSGRQAGRQDMVISYIAHRLGDGANLREVSREECVRRLAPPSEVEEIIQNPKLVEAARQKMQEGFRQAGQDLSSS